MFYVHCVSNAVSYTKWKRNDRTYILGCTTKTRRIVSVAFETLNRQASRSCLECFENKWFFFIFSWNWFFKVFLLTSYQLVTRNYLSLILNYQPHESRQPPKEIPRGKMRSGASWSSSSPSPDIGSFLGWVLFEKNVDSYNLEALCQLSYVL